MSHKQPMFTIALAVVAITVIAVSILAGWNKYGAVSIEDRLTRAERSIESLRARVAEMEKAGKRAP